MKLGGADVLVLNDFKTIKEALGKQKLVFEGRPQFDSFSNISQGKGIVFNSPQTQGKNWRKLKSVVVRHLHKFITTPETRDQLSDHIKKESVEFVRNILNLSKRSPDGVVDPESIINVSVANIVCAFMFGHRYDYNNEVRMFRIFTSYLFVLKIAIIFFLLEFEKFFRLNKFLFHIFSSFHEFF